MKGLLLAVAGLTAALLSSASAADKLDPSCSGCHALVKPSDASLDRLLTRKGPDLWFAGSKFKKEWLVSWLQDPKPIRPAGYPYFNTVKKGDKNDVPDPSKITPHPKLKKTDAEATAEALMALKAPADLVPAGIFKGDMKGARVGALAFVKFRGCVACHQGEKGEGGLSGPRCRRQT